MPSRRPAAFLLVFFVSLVALACQTAVPPPSPVATATEPQATATPYPTYTPLPTNTPVPTPTRRPPPTFTPALLWGATWNVPSERVYTVDGLHKDERRIWVTHTSMVLVGCRVTLAADWFEGRSWATFSNDGKFGSSHYLASVTGFDAMPSKETCVEMAVKYDSMEDYCYYHIHPGMLPKPGFSDTCEGWWQLTPLFILIDPTSYRVLPYTEWAREYRPVE